MICKFNTFTRQFPIPQPTRLGFLSNYRDIGCYFVYVCNGIANLHKTDRMINPMLVYDGEMEQKVQGMEVANYRRLSALF